MFNIEEVKQLIELAKENKLKKLAHNGTCVEFFTEPVSTIANEDFEKLLEKETLANLDKAQKEADEQDLFWSAL